MSFHCWFHSGPGGLTSEADGEGWGESWTSLTGCSSIDEGQEARVSIDCQQAVVALRFHWAVRELENTSMRCLTGVA